MRDKSHHPDAAEALDDCVCFNLRKTARAVTQTYDDLLRPAGLRTTQFSLLAVLASHGPLTIRALADRMVMDRTTLSRNLKLVEAQGLVSVATGPADRRTRIVDLTESGLAALARALPLWQRAQSHMVGRLGDSGWRQLRAALGEAVAAARAD